MESTFLWVLCKYIQAALIKNEWGRRCSDCYANSEQRKKYISLTEMYCLVSYLTIMFGILTIFSTLLIDDNNIAHLCCFFSSCDGAKWLSQSSAHCLSIAVLIFSLEVFQTVSTLLCQLDLIWFSTDIFTTWKWEMGFVFVVVLALVSLLFVALFESIVVVMSWIDHSQDQCISARGCFSTLTQLTSQDLSTCRQLPLQGRNKCHS